LEEIGALEATIIVPGARKGGKEGAEDRRGESGGADPKIGVSLIKPSSGRKRDKKRGWKKKH